MKRLPFTAESHLPAAVDGVRAALAGGGIVALPTETFYGLAVRPDDEAAVRRVFALKGRPAERALLVVAASVAQLAPWVRIPSRWRTRLAAAWPAPVTVVLPSASAAAAAGAATLAVRVPAHRLLRELLADVGPLTATSANASGAPPCARPATSPAPSDPVSRCCSTAARRPAARRPRCSTSLWTRPWSCARAHGGRPRAGA